MEAILSLSPLTRNLANWEETIYGLRSSATTCAEPPYLGLSKRLTVLGEELSFSMKPVPLLLLSL
jgi:hypothetical protein